MSDLIDRQAAIDAIDHICPVDTEYDCTLLDRVDVRYVLSDLPSAQPDREVGKWIDHSDDGYVECPFCRSATNCDDNIDELHYCFSCGAKMEVTDDAKTD